MDIDLRQAILERVKDKSTEELFSVIEGSIGGDDRALPGLGVLFEIIWSNCESSTQDQLVSTLKSNLS